MLELQLRSTMGSVCCSTDLVPMQTRQLFAVLLHVGSQPLRLH